LYVNSVSYNIFRSWTRYNGCTGRFRNNVINTGKLTKLAKTKIEWQTKKCAIFWC